MRLEPDVGGSGGGEIAHVGVVGTLAIAETLDQLGDEEIQVRVALAVGVGGQVDRYTVDRGGEVRAVIEIEAAQEILVRFAVA